MDQGLPLPNRTYKIDFPLRLFLRQPLLYLLCYVVSLCVERIA
jgi:hypothetical protein